MSNSMQHPEQTNILPDIDCPPWCTSSPHKPEDLHSALVDVGDFYVDVDQYIDLDGTSTGPIVARLGGHPETPVELDAQACRDLAAALLETARFIDSADQVKSL